MNTQQLGKAIHTRVIILIAACCTAALASAFADPPQYNVSSLETLGGASSGGNGLNNGGYVVGYSNMPDNMSRHATVWRNNASHTIIDLKTLGGPNSSVTWNMKNDRGLIVGISQTDIPDTSGEIWSGGYFFPGPNNTGFKIRGFVWKKGKMTGLPTLGGPHGFAAGVNNHGEVAGWAENTCVDSQCVFPQIYQFRPVIYGPRADQIRELPLLPDDTSGSATAINDNRVAIGISGICDQAFGRYTAKHAVIWKNGQVIDIKNLGGEFWNTPTAINQAGTVVGFAGVAGDPDGNALQAFIWTESDGMQPLPGLPGDVDVEAYSINNNGTVVGLSCDPTGVCKGVRWDAGVVTDLNCVKGDFPDRIESAKDINDAGEVTGRAISDAGVRTSYLAVPTDE